MQTINADMSIKEVLDIDRTTAAVFMDFGMHCLYCPHATAESVQEAGEVHGIDVDDLVNQLNDHIAAKAL